MRHFEKLTVTLLCKTYLRKISTVGSRSRRLSWRIQSPFQFCFLQKRLKEMEDLVLVLEKEEEAFLGAKDSKGKFSRITY